MAAKVKRSYTEETTIGDILYNTKTKTVFFNIQMGFMGRKSINLVQNQEGTYDMFGTYMKDGELHMYKMGKTFQVTDRNGGVVEGLTQGTLGLRTSWNKEIKKEVSSTEDAIFFMTHKLKENKKINDDLVKVGWVTGKYGFEIISQTPSQETPQTETTPEVVPQETTTKSEPEDTSSTEDDDEVPF